MRQEGLQLKKGETKTGPHVHHVPLSKFVLVRRGHVALNRKWDNQQRLLWKNMNMLRARAVFRGKHILTPMFVTDLMWCGSFAAGERNCSGSLKEKLTTLIPIRRRTHVGICKNTGPLEVLQELST